MGKRFKGDPDRSYQGSLDNRLFQGKSPKDVLPFTLKDKAQAMIKCRTTFTERECNIINTFCSSGEDLKYTMGFYKASKDSIYRLLKRLDDVFDNPA